MEKKIRVLFVCVHNSARSQMAEAFLNGLAGDKFVAESAGLSPQQLNPSGDRGDAGVRFRLIREKSQQPV